MVATPETQASTHSSIFGLARLPPLSDRNTGPPQVGLHEAGTKRHMSVPKTVYVPTTHDSLRTYDELFRLYSSAMTGLPGDRTVVLNFEGCTFLHESAVALLGGLIRRLQYDGLTVRVSTGSLVGPVLSNLRKNGFLKAFGFETRAGGNNTITFREDFFQKDNSFLDYLREEWLGRGWVDVSRRLQDAISSAIWEIYANGFEHGESPIGTFSCGQFYPKKKQIALSFVDFGVGIPATVRSVSRVAHLADSEAIAWALAKGNTSKTGNRGVGLDILRAFVELNQGRMDVLSHAGHVRVGPGGLSNFARAARFPGTLFKIALNADERHYRFQGELDVEDIF